MPAPQTSSELLELIRKSGLLDNSRLDAFLKSRPEALPNAPRPLIDLLIQDGLLTVFQASQLLAGKWRGFFIAGGKYKLLELLGVGGMGKVYLCEHRRMRRLVAVKVLPTDRLKEPTCLERFEREARAAGALDHPNIVHAYDLDQDGDLHFLVMEYVDGSTLHEMVKRSGPLSIVRACHYISQAADGLQYAHDAAGLIHRDVKPGNILVDRLGMVKLLDLGLARFFYDNSQDPITKRYEKAAVLGTADYLAPEQAVDSSEVDIRADIYSLGVTFYYLLTGQSPFEQGSITQKLIWHQNRQPAPLRSHRPDVPRELEAIVGKMMAKDPDDRFQEPIDVVDALQPWTEEPVDPPTNPEMPKLCPALESAVMAALSGPASGGSSVRLRRGGPRSGYRQRPVTSAGGSRRQGLWIALISVAVTALIAVGVYWATIAPLLRSTTSPQLNIPPQTERLTPPVVDLPSPDALPSPAEGTLFVTRDPMRRSAAVDRPDVLETLGEALARAVPNTRVVVLDGPVEGQFRIDGARVAGLSIEGRGDGGPLVEWHAPANPTRDQPLLAIAHGGGIHISGFAFDGDRHIDTLLRIQGECAGMKLENLELSGALTDTIELGDVESTDARPLVFDRIRCTTIRDYPNAGEIRCRAAIHVSGQTAPVIVVRESRFEGMYRSALWLDSAGAIDVRLNRFCPRVSDGSPIPAELVAVQSAGHGRLRLTLASNTTANCATLLRLDEIPALASGSTFLLRSNLMYAGNALVAAEPGADAAPARTLFAGSTGNVARPGDCQRGLSVCEIVTVAFPALNFDPLSDRFLRYLAQGETLPLYTAGAGGEPAGVPPIE